MAKVETILALRFVLAEKVYPLQPELVRNDTKTAQLVHRYVQKVQSETHEWWRKKATERSRLEDELLDSRFALEPLFNISEDTLRKYIAELWKIGEFTGDVCFRSVKSKE